MRPVLFLDIDGVLNHTEAFRRAEDGSLIVLADKMEVLDPECVKQLNRVVSQTGCEVVVSSTWRLGHTLIHLEQLLAAAGYEHHLLSTTPSIPDRERGNEIKAWLARHPGYRPVAIVDDDDDMGTLFGRLAKTDFANGGLTAKVADRLIALLGGEP